MRLAVIGAGGWGTALSIMAARAGHEVRLWARGAALVEEINGRRVNGAYLAGREIPEGVRATSDAREALRGAEAVILAAPSHATREVLTCLRAAVEPGVVFVSAAKGVEAETGKRMSEVVGEVLGENAARFVCLSGPSFAQEVAEGQPTAVVAASADESLARLVQSALSTQSFRVYTNPDVVGTELGGASKNVMALAAGMVAGLGLGRKRGAARARRSRSPRTADGPGGTGRPRADLHGPTLAQPPRRRGVGARASAHRRARGDERSGRGRPHDARPDAPRGAARRRAADYR